MLTNVTWISGKLWNALNKFLHWCTFFNIICHTSCRNLEINVSFHLWTTNSVKKNTSYLFASPVALLGFSTFLLRAQILPWFHHFCHGFWVSQAPLGRPVPHAPRRNGTRVPRPWISPQNTLEPSLNGWKLAKMYQNSRDDMWWRHDIWHMMTLQKIWI